MGGSKEVPGGHQFLRTTTLGGATNLLDNNCGRSKMLEGKFFGGAKTERSACAKGKRGPLWCKKYQIKKNKILNQHIKSHLLFLTFIVMLWEVSYCQAQLKLPMFGLVKL